MNKYNFLWPEILTCENFPDVNSGEFCVDPQETETEETDEFIAVSKEQKSQETDPEEVNDYVTEPMD